MSPPPSWCAPALSEAGVAHAFFGRRGGISTGIYASLNAGPGSDDDPAAVAENRARIAAAIGGSALVTMNQQHTAMAHVVEGPWPGRWPPGDALVTATRGLALGVLTADCAPVLLADVEAGVIGVAHAGWKGAVSGVLEAALEAMRTLGGAPVRIIAAIGPTIQQVSYEVGPEFVARFVSEDTENAVFFAPGAGDRAHFDLPAYVARRLHRAGVEIVASLANDTCAEADDFFSNRRAVKRGEPDYGRNCAVIRLAP